jgi:hypothetical protein
MDIASLLFPQAPSYATGLLGEEEAARLQGQARQAGLLNLGLGLLAAGGPAAVRPGLGQGLIQGLSAGQQAYQNVYSQRLQEMELARKIAEQRRMENVQQMMQQLAPRALAGDQEAMSQLAQFLPPEQLSKFTTAAKTAQEMRTPAKPEYREVGGALYEMVPGQPPKPVVSPTGKLTGDFANVALGLYGTANVAELPQDAFTNIQREILKGKEAGRMIIDMTAGEKGFKNEMDLRKEWAASPEYKSYVDMKSAWDSVQTALKENTPIGDTAAATKIMKLLDPGSVVRESELAIAMQATGALDRIRNYADSIIKGTKLTGAQKQEFGRLADQLYNAAAQVYNAKRDNYISIAEDYGLNAQRIAGKPAQVQTKPAQVPANLVDMAREELKQRELKRNRGQ